MRPNRDEIFLKMAQLVAQRSTCWRRNVGCILVNKRGHVLATGYNGVASGMPHCNEENKCPGANSPSGTNLDGCEAIHAEENALLQCHDVHEIDTCYCTTSPCFSCIKKLMNTSCKRIVFLDLYPHTKSQELWERVPDHEWVWYDHNPNSSLLGQKDD